MKNIIYDITKLAERFLEVEYLNSDESQRNRNLLYKFYEKHLENIFINIYSGYEKNRILSSYFHDYLYRDHLDIKLLRFYLEAINPKLHTKHVSVDITELMIFDFMAGFSNNYNNVYIGESELNEIPENDFVRIFTKTIFTNSGLEK
ncbi:MAG TPA: hypothetical protein PKA90_03275 [Ignavibacteria bacterium]|nr:hypothetical protein [Ignavibacteria bacterium]HMR39431.1 hypothetical protein [Ignavibacteria bacterium]